MSKLSARPIVKKFIELNGQSGQFNIDKKSIKVKYFSTFASNSNDSHDSMALLKELKPMRERVKARDISNLDSLLQRDLNDNRVASELIPYLIDERSPVAFFPAILAVLIPKGFLQQVEASKYPMGQKVEGDVNDNLIVNYDDLWKLESFKIGDKTSSLGILSIDPENVDIVVLDGQHRANAFRVVTGTFDTEKNSIYSTFYKGITKVEDFKADLPVTIIWFDNDKEIFDPKIISRRLFVDVNNNAKKVSQSRTILLDEAEISSLMTRFFYSNLADRNKFKTDKFSLFHSDFDLDSDINVSSSNIFAITNPQIVYDIHSWFTLGRLDRYSNLSKYSVSREAFRNSVLRFGEIFKDSEFNGDMIQSDEEETTSWKRVVIKDPFSVNSFESSYKTALAPVLFNIFDKFSFYLKHFQACAKVESADKDHVQQAVWEEIFMGGEGLYYTFKNTDLKSKKSDETFNKYLSAIDSLEKLLRQERVSLFRSDVQKKVNIAYIAANSKAFQIGLFMAFDYFREDNPVLETYENFIQALNRKSAEDWVLILTDVKQKVITGVDPKRWPAYQNLILRVIQTNQEYYNATNFKDSPDYLVIEKSLEASFNSWYDITEPNFEDLSMSTISAKNYNKWIHSAIDEYKELFSSANIDLIDEVDLDVLGKAILKEFIRKIRE